jgi:hypothetical protein
MNSRAQRLLLFLVLAAGLYGLGWLVGHQVNSGRQRGGHRSVEVMERQTETAGALPAQPDTNLLAAAQTEREMSRLVARRAELRALQTKVLELDRSGDWRAAREALGDFKLLLMSLQAEDYPAVWKWFSELKSPFIRAPVQRALIDVWSRVDPRAALPAVLSLPQPWRMADESVPGGGSMLAPYSPMSVVLAHWGEKEPQAAMAWVEQLPAEIGREGAALPVIQGMAKSDPRAAAQCFEQLPPSPAREGQVLSVVAGLAAVDPEAAAAFLAKQSWSSANEWQTSSEREVAVAQVAEALAAEAPQKALDWAQTLTQGADRQNALAAALSHMAGARQLPEAARFVESLANPQERQRLTTELVSRLAFEDTQTAAAWVGQFSGDESLRKVAWDGLKNRWAQYEPAAVVQFALTTFPAGETRVADFVDLARHSLADQRLRLWPYDDTVVLNLVSQLPTGPEREAVTAILIEQWAEYGPARAAQLTAALTPGAEQARLASTVARQWAAWEPTAAADWVATFPAGAAREQSLPAVAVKWAEQDPVATSAWLETLPADVARAKAVKTFLSKLGNNHPELAARWVAASAEEQKRP